MASEQVTTFSNGTIISKKDGKWKKIVVQSQNAEQTMPTSVEEDVSAGVPRDKSVGLDQTDAEVIEYSHDYSHGDAGSDTDVVPRASGGSGMEGWDKPEFADEVADDATSGKPDSYFQKFTPNDEPSKAGSKENHVANLEKEVAMLKKALDEKSKELLKEKVLRKREVIARKIVDLEVTAGLTNITDEEEIEKLVESKLENTVEILENDLNRLKSLCSMIDSGQIVKTSSTKTAMPKIKQDQFSLQSLMSYPQLIDTNKQDNILPTISSGNPVKNMDKYSELAGKIGSKTTLSRKFNN